MSQEKYIAAIEIASSKIIGAVGRTTGNGQLDVIAVEQQKGIESVRYGIIQNIDETTTRIIRVINQLEKNPALQGRKIVSFYVGISGRSLRSVPTEVSLNLPEDTVVTDEIISRLTRDAQNAAIDSTLEVVDAVPRIYTVGKTETLSPRGVAGDHIKGIYDLIVCRPEMQRNIRRVIDDKLGIDIKKFVVSPLASAHMILTSEEKRLGCMLVDMGAETTSVCIYKGGYLRYFATLPLGGRNITRDLTTLNILEERAEDIKLTSGNALPRESASNLNLNGIKYSEVNNRIVARSEEIVANIVEQIEYAELKESDLPGGIILIGGGSNLSGMPELISNQSGLNTRMGHLPSYVRMVDNRIPGSKASEVISVLYTAAALPDNDCLEDTTVDELPPTGDPNKPEVKVDKGGDTPRPPKKRNPFIEKVQRTISGLFRPAVDDSDELE